jgi:hypothetical protein
LALVGLATALATFQKVGGFFSKSFGHPDGLLISKFLMTVQSVFPQNLKFEISLDC